MKFAVFLSLLSAVCCVGKSISSLRFRSKLQLTKVFTSLTVFYILNASVKRIHCFNPFLQIALSAGEHFYVCVEINKSKCCSLSSSLLLFLLLVLSYFVQKIMLLFVIRYVVCVLNFHQNLNA